MSGPKRNPDRLNTIGVVVVGICGAVLVYVTIVALEAFYVNDTSEIQTMADYGGQDTVARSIRTEQINRINEYGTNPRPAPPKGNEPVKPQTFRVPITHAMKLVVDGAKTEPSALVPGVARSESATVLPIFGRPKLTPPPAGATPAPSTPPPGPPAPGAAPAGAAGGPAGSAAGATPGGTATGSGAVAPSAPLVPTGTGTGPAPVGGAGPLDKASVPATPPPEAAKAPPPAKGNGQ
jgi:hypothetical protein